MLCHAGLLLAFSRPLQAGNGAETSQAIRSVELDPEQTYRVRELGLKRGDVQFFLTEGYLIFSKPVLGAPIAAVFSSQVDAGDGEVLLLPPNPDERRTLSKHAGGANLEEHLVDAAFVFADNTAAELMTQIQNAPSVRRDPDYGRKMAGRYHDVISRIAPQFETRLLLDLLTGSHTPDHLFAALLGGKTLGGFDIVFDPRSSEQILVGQPRAGSTNGYSDVWASYTPKSLISVTRTPDFHAGQYRIDSHLDANLGMRVESTFTVSGISRDLEALSFDLSRQMRITAVEVDGQPAEISETPNVIVPGTDPGDRLFLIIPPAPLRAGTEHVVKVSHSGNVISTDANHVYFVGSRGRWYPHRALEFARFDLKFQFPDSLDLVAPGETISDHTENGERTIENHIDTPLPMAGFNLGSYDCRTLRRGDLRVELCGNRALEPTNGPSVPNSTLAAKIADVMEFYSERFGPPPLKKLIVSPIPGKFGQGFGGLIYLSTMAYMSPSGKTFSEMNQQSQIFFTELMRAHEAAHQWWGNLVLTESYHDEWIMEALANYSAMLYLQSRGESDAVSLLLETYRQGLLQRRADKSEVEQSGPVTQARRIDPSEDPDAWVTIMYGKGTWIMQMLHARMGTDNFWKMLAELRRKFERKNLTTEEFRNLCASLMPAGVPDRTLHDFFDQWVYGMGIPKLHFASNVKNSSDGSLLKGTLTQSGVPDDFSADFPVQIDVHGKKTLRWVRSSSEPVTISIPVAARPDHVELDPDNKFLKR